MKQNVTTFSTMNVSVRELKSHLSDLLNRVAAGERITVTKRGKPIATVSAVSAEHVENDPLRRLERADWITRPTKPKRVVGLKNPPRIRPKEKTLSEIVHEDRG